MLIRLLSCLLGAIVLSWPALLSAQGFKANYDESKVPKFTLPDPLVLASGKRVGDAKTWRAKRRPEILKLFQDHVYGRAPKPLKRMKFRVVETAGRVLGGKAIRKQVRVQFDGRDDGPGMDLLVYLPADAKRAVPVFIGLNFNGNHAIHADPAIRLARSWHRNDAAHGYVNNRATDKSRGISASRWAVERCLARGYGVATIYCGDIDPDYHDKFQNGVHPLFYRDGQTAPDGGEWGTIGAWAWGLSRAVDYFETDRDIDHRRVILLGHSRLGKTSLWAGARDERFAIVISNNSGCGGAALSRRRFGETVGRINNSFPHWFCGNFKKFNDRENDLPVDQHMLVALIAPRPVYIASAQQDRWADPRGEFLSALNADPVYRLLGTEGLGSATMPAVDQPVHGRIAYHVRSGRHDVTDFDWQQYIAFAEKHLAKK